MMSEQISVVIIENDENIRNIVEYNLQLDGFEVYPAANGLTGLELVRQMIPDVILLDWMMPEMDGLEVLTELKKDEQAKNIPVFMLTAKGGRNNIKLALDKGAVGYFEKPLILPAKLGRRIRDMLEILVKG